MSLPTAIHRLDELLSYTAVSESPAGELEILELIRRINAQMLRNYDTQKEYIGDLFSVYERHNPNSVVYLLCLIDELTAQIDVLQLVTTDLSIRELPNSEESLRVAAKVYDELSKTGKTELRLSSDFDLPLTKDEKEIFISLTNFMLNSQAEGGRFDEDDMLTSVKNLAIVRNLAKSLGRVEQFYLLLRSLFDLFQRYEKFQLARDFAEECLICGYKDGMKDIAYAQVLRVYANTAAVPPAIHYCLGSMLFAIEKNRLVDFCYKGIIVSLMRLYRNAGLFKLAKDVYENRSRRVVFQGYEERLLVHGFFFALVQIADRSAPQRIIDYIDQHRENIFDNSEVEILPWLATLYNVQAIYGIGIAENEQCQRYIDFFEQIVSEHRWKPIKEITLPSSLEALCVQLRVSLTNLASTRSELDFTTDNTRARVISSRVIKMAFTEQNWRAYLLAMIINSDYSLTFKNRVAPDLLEVTDAENRIEEIYNTPDEVGAFVETLNDYAVVWMGSNDSQVYPMTYDTGNFKFERNASFGIARFQKWIDDNFSTLPLEEDRVGIGGMKMPKSPDDFCQEEKSLIEELGFTAVDSCPGPNILIVKDYEISSFPHNLLLSKNFGFLTTRSPIMNIMSADWLLEHMRSERKLKKSFTKGIWIPTQTGDWAINYLYSYIEDELARNNFSIYQDLIPDSPLGYDLNIIAAHGKPEISSFPALFASNENETFSIVQLNHVIGKGKILVLFVCHSGSMKTDILRNRISTMVRSYLKLGYEAVIAPFWALDIAICRDWLPGFLESLGAGNPLIKAVHDGNMRVKERYPTPRAYACLHAYGNPFFKMEASAVYDLHTT